MSLGGCGGQVWLDIELFPPKVVPAGAHFWSGKYEFFVKMTKFRVFHRKRTKMAKNRDQNECGKFFFILCTGEDPRDLRWGPGAHTPVPIYGVGEPLSSHHEIFFATLVQGG